MSRRGPLSFPVARGERLRGLALEQVLAGRSSEAGTEHAMELRIAPEAGRKRRFEEVAGARVHALEKAREAELVSVLHDGALRRSLEGAREAPGRHRQLLGHGLAAQRRIPHEQLGNAAHDRVTRVRYRRRARDEERLAMPERAAEQRAQEGPPPLL